MLRVLLRKKMNHCLFIFQNTILFVVNDQNDNIFCCGTIAMNTLHIVFHADSCSFCSCSKFYVSIIVNVYLFEIFLCIFSCKRYLLKNEYCVLMFDSDMFLEWNHMLLQFFRSLFKYHIYYIFGFHILQF